MTASGRVAIPRIPAPAAGSDQRALAAGSLWRKLNPRQQALLVLACLRKGETFAATGDTVADWPIPLCRDVFDCRVRQSAMDTISRCGQ